MPTMSDLTLRFQYFLKHPAYQGRPIRSWVRLVWWRLQCFLKVPATIRLARWNAHFHLPPRWGGEGTAMVYVFKDKYETELTHLDRMVRSGDVFMDAGANCGIFTVAAGKLVGDSGRVIAIEPTRRAEETLRKNIDINQLTNARVYASALYDHDGTARLYHNRGPVAASVSFEDIEGETYDEVETICIDSIVERENLSQLDVIKLDIEGAEEPALRGGVKAIARWHPLVIFEVNPGAAAFSGSETNEAWDLLLEWGYQIFQLSGEGELEPFELDTEEFDWEFCNFVAVHPEGPARNDKERSREQ